MKLGYARVSTTDQSVHLQTDALKSAGCGRIFEDAGVSGAKIERPGLNRAMKTLQSGDNLVVWRLDRLSRSVLDLSNMLSGLTKRGVALRSVCEYFDTATPLGRLIVHILAAFAEFERDMTIERTKAGMAAARARGARIGRPRAIAPKVLAKALAMRRQPNASVAQIAERIGVKRSTLYRALKLENANSTFAVSGEFPFDSQEEEQVVE